MWLGFFLIDGSLGKDKSLNIDVFIKSGVISRKKYFLLKAWSNTIMLNIIVVFIFVMAVIMFFVRRETDDFSFLDFVVPFVTITIPASIFTGHLSVILEAVTGRFSVVRILIFVFSLALILPPMQSASPGDLIYFQDALGLSNFFLQISNILQQEFHTTLSGFSMGYQFYDKTDEIDFVISEFSYSFSFLLSRSLIPVLMTLLVLASSLMPEKVFKNSFSGNQRSENQEGSMNEFSQSLALPSFKVTHEHNLIRLIILDFRSLVTFKKTMDKLANCSNLGRFVFCRYWHYTSLFVASHDPVFFK